MGRENMGISIYYTAKRERPLTSDEQAAIAMLKDRYAVEKEIESWEPTSGKPMWESFCVYDHPTEPGVIFEGATRLPDNSMENLWIGLQHWCALLSEIRRVVSGADWHVHVDDHYLQWDAARRAWDPSL